MGDSIMRQLNDEPGCMNEIAKDYKKKGLSVGISGERRVASCAMPF